MSTEYPQPQQAQQFTDADDYLLAGDESTVERKRLFLEHYRVHGVIYRAAQAARIHRTTVYKWLQSDEVFVQAFSDCHEDTYDELEASGFQKALAGDPILTMFYLKAHRPKFRDKVAVDIQLIDEEIRERMRQLQQAQGLLLPPATMTTDDYHDSNGHSAQALRYEPISVQPDDQQKDD